MPIKSIPKAYPYFSLFSFLITLNPDNTLGPIKAPKNEPMVRKPINVRSILPIIKCTPVAVTVFIRTIKREVPITTLRGNLIENRPAKTGAVPLIPKAPVIIPATNPKNELFIMPDDPIDLEVAFSTSLYVFSFHVLIAICVAIKTE